LLPDCGRGASAGVVNVAIEVFSIALGEGGWVEFLESGRVSLTLIKRTARWGLEGGERKDRTPTTSCGVDASGRSAIGSGGVVVLWVTLLNGEVRRG